MSRVPPRKRGILAGTTARQFFNFLGYSGVLFIVYGAVSQGTGTVWPPLEVWVTPLSSFLTLVGVLLTASSVYFAPSYPHPPEQFSLYVSAPFTILGCLVSLVFLIWNGSLPPVIVNGFAMLGIAGGFFRIQRRPSEF
jgi:hypothetical protein